MAPDMANAQNPKSSREEAPVEAESAAGDSVAKPVAFDLASFKLEHVTFEVRYPFALALWDKAGLLWQSIQEKWPDIVLVSAEPAKTTFRLGKTVLMVEIKAARITSSDPDKKLDEFAKMSRDFLTAVTQHLKIPLLERIGLRVIYFKDFKDREATAAAFLALNLLRVPDSKKFEVSSTPVNPQYLLRWESEAKGVWLQLRADTRKVDFEPPAEMVNILSPIHTEKNGVVFDCDYYTVASAEPGQVDAAEWIKHGLHVIHRDSSYIFEV